jgi:hypothetical protein
LPAARGKRRLAPLPTVERLSGIVQPKTALLPNHATPEQTLWRRTRNSVTCLAVPGIMMRRRRVTTCDQVFLKKRAFHAFLETLRRRGHEYWISIPSVSRPGLADPHGISAHNGSQIVPKFPE